MTSEECVTQTRDALTRLEEEKPISSIIESMFDRIVATDILSSAGDGTDKKGKRRAAMPRNRA